MVIDYPLSHLFIHPSIYLSIHSFIDTYGGITNQSKLVTNELTALSAQINHELRFQTKAFELMGIIDSILTATASRSRWTQNDDAKLQTEEIKN